MRKETNLRIRPLVRIRIRVNAGRSEKSRVQKVKLELHGTENPKAKDFVCLEPWISRKLGPVNRLQFVADCSRFKGVSREYCKQKL